MTPGPVVLDLQALQSPGLQDRGTGQYALQLAVALEQGHPQLVGRYLLNPDLLPPEDLGPLLAREESTTPTCPTQLSRELACYM